ncbi:hypothetical protein M9Y10_039220 [Tritrichomonas musculus]|uniref:Uncharacterized protein n=1 Tax=Tritrichomonas musculus TaxID=1915356 RepID=A0ABR2KAK0_9EUKA
MSYFNQDSENTSDSSSNSNSNNKASSNNGNNNSNIIEEQKMILAATHPLDFEQQNQPQSNLNQNQLQQKQLTITQKAIIACMNMNGGMASENQILRFIRKHWQFIRKNTNKEYRDPANIRLLHINFRTRKNKVFLFVEAEKGSGIWKCNTDASNTSGKQKGGLLNISSASGANDNSTFSNCSTDKSNRHNWDPTNHQQGDNHRQFYLRQLEGSRFEDLLIDLLRENNEGLTLDEIVDLAAPFINVPGYLKELNEIDPEGKGKRRIRAVLTIKLHSNEVIKDENTQKWFLKDESPKTFYRYNIPKIKNKKSSDDLPESLKNFRITDLSSDELWKIVRKRHQNDAK